MFLEDCSDRATDELAASGELDLILSDHWTVGTCKACREGHTLVDGLCWNCRRLPVVRFE